MTYGVLLHSPASAIQNYLDVGQGMWTWRQVCGVENPGNLVSGDSPHIDL
jgi:hypothetical protein